MLLTYLSVLNTILIGVFIVILLKFKASIPDIIQEGLNTVGDSMSKILAEPQVKRAMSVLGSKSGDARASKALKNRVANKALDSNIVIKKALDYFGLTALEGIELMQDPTFGPIIQGFIAKGTQGLMKGGQGLLGGFNSGGQNAVVYGREE